MQVQPPSESQNLILNLKRRAELTQHVRQFFIDHDYWELDTPLLLSETCIDRWIDPFELQVSGRRCFLQTSPEFAMKRMLCRGADSIFQICKAFRAGESGERHNPEFTLLEWYRNNIRLSNQIDFVEELVTSSLQFAVNKQWILPEFASPNFERITYEAAFIETLDVSPHTASMDSLVTIAKEHGFREQKDQQTDRDDVLNFLLATCIEPEFAKRDAVALMDYPASQAALARTRSGTVEVAERFEMYFRGQEICNGYQELTDPIELRKRMVTQNEKRIQDNKAPLPIDSQLIRIMEKTPLPESSGVALGLDRLVMLCLNCTSLGEVLAIPFDKT